MFEDEILAMVKAGVMDVEIIFSQDECIPIFGNSEIEYKEAPGRKGHIDKIMSSLEERLAHMMGEHGAHIYICGVGGMAKMAMERIEKSACNIYGEEQGEMLVEKAVAENRLVFNVFTTLLQPTARTGMDLSELCQCNDFLGVRNGEEQRLLLVINATVYDMTNFCRDHPGGDGLLKLYCGTDATQAWNAVGHSEAHEVEAVLEMYDAKMTFRNVEANLKKNEKEWYICGWKEMTMALVEIQNCMSLAFEKSWEAGTFTAAEKDMGAHFVVWERKAVWRPKVSLLKGELFAATHDRLWSVYLPLLFSDCFDELQIHMTVSDGDSYAQAIQLLMEQLGLSHEQDVCDCVYPLIMKELDKLSATANGIVLPPALQSYMEELRGADDRLLESLKARLITGLRVFETHKSPIMPAFYATFDNCILGIIEDLNDFMSEIMSLTINHFGDEQVNEVTSGAKFRRGGIALIGNADLDVCHNYASDFSPKCPVDIEACPMHLGT